MNAQYLSPEKMLASLKEAQAVQAKAWLTKIPEQAKVLGAAVSKAKVTAVASVGPAVPKNA